MRSTDNYPAFLAGWLSVESYARVTCSAADTSDLPGEQQIIGGGTVALQLDALSEETDLVTLGIGGNDFGSSPRSSAARRVGEAARPALQQHLLRDAGRVEGRVAGRAPKVAERAPEAEVFVVVSATRRCCPRRTAAAPVPLPDGPAPARRDRGPAAQRVAARRLRSRPARRTSISRGLGGARRLRVTQAVI